MQCTEKYFEADAFRTRAESVLLAAVPDSRTGGGLLALEGTVFYPEGGGQPADRGTLTLPDGTELAVTDVHEQDGILWHSVPSLPDTAVPGITVEEAIDWDWRFDKMQQHTGEHILSGILHRMFGAENVGFHIGAEAVRMDTSVPISAEGLRAAELEANRIVWQDVPVVITYPTREELAQTLERMLAYGNHVIVEKKIKGREIQVAVLGDTYLPAVEIIPRGAYFDYFCKYQKDGAQEICPAPITQEQWRTVGELALRLHRALDLGVYSRADFILDEEGSFWCLEINTLPGMTPTSLVPQEAAQVGLSYGDLCQRIVDESLALRKGGRA